MSDLGYPTLKQARSPPKAPKLKLGRLFQPKPTSKPAGLGFGMVSPKSRSLSSEQGRGIWMGTSVLPPS